MIIIEIVYLLSALLLAVYGLNSLVLTWLYHRYHPKNNHSDSSNPPATTSQAKTVAEPIQPPTTDFPAVTVQLPVFNEQHVVVRLLKAVLSLDWPADKLQVQVLDDSTDSTTTLIDGLLKQYRANGSKIDFAHLHRTNRSGFKAGALQAGLGQTTGEFIAIFDADFVPRSDFLKETIGNFRNPKIGCVQTRWGHLNPESSYLTKAQSLGIDGHFIVEQSARHYVNAFLNFNGTAGVWRKACMLDAGGWQRDTLTEDLDLSYRAQLCGWQIAYQPQVIVPAELPVQISAFKRQQFRWAKGSIQTARKLLWRLWKSPERFGLKVLGTLHLTNYAVHPLMLINLLLTLPIMGSNNPFLKLTPLFMLSAIGPPLLYWTAIQTKKRLMPITRLGRLALLIALGTGLSLNNTKAVFEAILGIDSPFKRTPKFAVTDQSPVWQTSTYILPRNPAAWLELLLALYAFSLLICTFALGTWWLIPWLLIYTSGYGYVSGLAFVQAWQTSAIQSQLPKQHGA